MTRGRQLAEVITATRQMKPGVARKLGSETTKNMKAVAWRSGRECLTAFRSSSGHAFKPHHGYVSPSEKNIFPVLSNAMNRPSNCPGGPGKYFATSRIGCGKIALRLVVTSKRVCISVPVQQEKFLKMTGKIRLSLLI